MRLMKVVSVDYGGCEYVDCGGFFRMICYWLVLD